MSEFTNWTLCEDMPFQEEFPHILTKGLCVFLLFMWTLTFAFGFFLLGLAGGENFVCSELRKCKTSDEIQALIKKPSGELEGDSLDLWHKFQELRKGVAKWTSGAFKFITRKSSKETGQEAGQELKILAVLDRTPQEV